MAKLHKKWFVSHFFLKQLYPPKYFGKYFLSFLLFVFIPLHLNYKCILINLRIIYRKLHNPITISCNPYKAFILIS